LTTVKPTGWRAEGGVVRVNHNDVRTGFRLASPRRARVDLTPTADRLANLAGPSNFKNAAGEVTFAGTRAGAQVTGTIMANTLMLYSPAQDLMMGNYSRDISGYVGPRRWIVRSRMP
jgi:hypothetical protein